MAALACRQANTSYKRIAYRVSISSTEAGLGGLLAPWKLNRPRKVSLGS
jgi:hypothetical protein